MAKRVLLSTFLILVAWILIDLLLHNHLLAPLYEQNPNLWRPLNQMSVALAFLARLLLLGSFVATYAWLVGPRRLGTGIAFGALTGLTLGVGVGLGTYIHSPIPVALAWGWFWAAMIKSLAGGVIVGLLIKETPQIA